MGLYEKIMNESERAQIDAAMLDSLAASFEMAADGRELMLSFNPQDIADLMRRCAVRPAKKQERSQ